MSEGDAKITKLNKSKRNNLPKQKETNLQPYYTQSDRTERNLKVKQRIGRYVIRNVTGFTCCGRGITPVVGRRWFT